MEYTYLDLACYLLIYSFLGWTAEVIYISVKYRELRNRGFFNLPFCLSYGVILDILILIIPTMSGNVLMEYLAALAVSSVITFLSGGLSKRISRTALWEYQENNLFSGERRPFFCGLLQGLLFLLAALLLHPLVFFVINLIPVPIKCIVCLIITVLLAADLILILYTLRSSRTREEVETLLARPMKEKRHLSERLMSRVWHRVLKAYPGISRMELADKAVFAKGICFDKLVWVFLTMAVGGCLFETVFIWIKNGVLMSRSSLIYGPFSIIWGFGSVFLTIVLQRLKNKEDRYIFFSGALLGGIYEYTCSVISEVFFGTTFWDYSDMPFNFGGRTNLLFCLFWGIVSVWWVKWAFPLLSRYIEKIPPVVGKIITWVILAFLVLDCIISAAALLRYVDRISNPEAANIFIRFLDQMYPDTFLERVWPNLRLTG